MRGGAREGSGRKPKAEEQELIGKLSPHDDAAIEKLLAGVESGDIQFLKLFMEYRYGKPKQTIDANLEGSLQIEQITGMEIK